MRTRLPATATPRLAQALAAACLLVPAVGCDSAQAPRVALAVVVDGDGVIPFENAEGYAITLTKFRVAFDDVEFTTGGEMHGSLLRRLGTGVGELLVPTAFAHPGHYGGGEITGEMTGRFVVDWQDDGAVLGEALLLGTTYTGANFVFTRAALGDGVAADDPIIGHTMEIAGVATRGGQAWTFHGFVDQEEGKRVIGLPIGEEVSAVQTEFRVDAGTDDTLGLQVLMVDPFEPETAFDGIDFAAFDDDGDGDIELVAGEIPNNLLTRQLQVHDHYRVSIR